MRSMLQLCVLVLCSAAGRAGPASSVLTPKCEHTGRVFTSSGIPPPLSQDSTAPSLSANRLQAHRGDRELFTDLNIEIGAGEALQIVGPNGCGKTTLLRVLCGLVQPTEGDVLWRNQPIIRDRMAFHNELCYLGYAGGIKLELTAAENLECALALQPARSEMDVWAALKRVDLYGFEDVPCYALSAGQRRRVSLARLLLVAAPLWVLDEPLTALDRNGVKLAESLICEHLDASGIVVLTTHQPLSSPPAGALALTLGNS